MPSFDHISTLHVKMFNRLVSHVFLDILGVKNMYSKWPSAQTTPI
jgi:hypothetical protein